MNMKKITFISFLSLILLIQTTSYGATNLICENEEETLAIVNDQDFNVPIPMSADFSVMARIEVTGFDTEIFSWINLDDLENPFSTIDITPDGKLRFSIPGIGFSVICLNELELNGCYHLAVTCDAGLITLYVDGVPEVSEQVDVVTMVNYINSLNIDPEDLEDTLVGNIPAVGDFLINEISIFDIPLEDEDIFFYNLNLPGGAEFGLVLAYNYSINGFPFEGVPDNWSQYLCEGTLSTNELDQDVSMSIYPNPTSNYVSFSNLKTSKACMIYDTLGKIVLTAEIEPNKQLDVTALKSGMYFVKIEGAEALRLIKN